MHNPTYSTSKQPRAHQRILLYCVLFLSGGGFATADKFCLRQLSDGLYRPVALELVGNQAFVAEHHGKIRQVDLTSGHHHPVVDLSSRILTSTSWMDHRGLLSLRFINASTATADFGASAETADATRLNGLTPTLLVSSSRVSHDPAADHDTVVTALPISQQGEILADQEYELVRVAQPSSRYNGGQLLSRSAQGLRTSRQRTGNVDDGHADRRILYLTTGDGAMKHNESTRFDPKTLTGKILRMTLRFDGAQSNDGIRRDGPALAVSKPEIFASGFRNPWRCAIDNRASTTDAGLEQLFCGDTAIGPHPEEEIFLVRYGGRYGHPEGGTIADETPIYRYQLAAGNAVIGGLVYRGTQLPNMKDAFVFGDYVSGNIFALREHPSSTEQWQVEELQLRWCPAKDSDSANKAVGEESESRPNLHIVAFAQDNEGELLVLAEDKLKSGLVRGGIFTVESYSSSKIPSPIPLGPMLGLALVYWAITKI